MLQRNDNGFHDLVSLLFVLYGNGILCYCLQASLSCFELLVLTAFWFTILFQTVFGWDCGNWYCFLWLWLWELILFLFYYLLGLLEVGS